MHNLYMQEPENKCVAVREASPAYGAEFLTETSPRDQPSSGAWRIILMPTSPTWHKYHFCNTPTASKESIVVLIKSEWLEKTDPFTQENLLYSEDEQVQELIFQIKTSLTIPYRQKLANRLVTLFKDSKEEDPDSSGISVGSLRYFYYFLQSHINLKCPTISITPEYNIYASWRDDQKRVFSVHFLPNGDVRFVIFKPNKSHPEKQVRFSGIATTDILMDEVSLTGELDWVSE